MVQIKLVQLVSSQGADGRNAEAVGDQFGAWAEVSDPSGFSDFVNGQVQIGTTKKFLTRFRFDKYPKVNWKVNYQGIDWAINSIQQVKEKRFFWLIRATKKSDV